MKLFTGQIYFYFALILTSKLLTCLINRIYTLVSHLLSTITKSLLYVVYEVERPPDLGELDRGEEGGHQLVLQLGARTVPPPAQRTIHPPETSV